MTGGYDLSCVVDFCQITGAADTPVFKELKKRGGTVDTLPLEVGTRGGLFIYFCILLSN